VSGGPLPPGMVGWACTSQSHGLSLMYLVFFLIHWPIHLKWPTSQTNYHQWLITDQQLITNHYLWFSYGFPMIFLWFSYGFPMVFRWFSYGFPMKWPIHCYWNHHQTQRHGTPAPRMPRLCAPEPRTCPKRPGCSLKRNGEEFSSKRYRYKWYKYRLYKESGFIWFMFVFFVNKINMRFFHTSQGSISKIEVQMLQTTVIKNQGFGSWGCNLSMFFSSMESQNHGTCSKNVASKKALATDHWLYSRWPFHTGTQPAGLRS